MTIQQLVVEFTSRFDGRGVSSLLDGMRNIRTETEGVISTMNRLGAVFTAVTGAATVAFKNYEFSLTEFAGKAMKSTDEFGRTFSKVSGDIARSTGLARAEVLRGLQEGTSAQLRADLSADLTKKAAILGAGRQSLMRQTVNVALSGYRNAFGDPGKVLDYVYASAQLGQGQVPEFAPAAQYVFPFARGAGIGLSEVAAGLSAISTTAPSPLMGSTQFGAFLTGVARGSTYEDMLKEKTGGRSSQDIRDMLRNEGLARTTSFLASHFNGDELQQVYGRKELVQFVQGVTGQPGLLARLEQMITQNAESGPIEKFGADLENTLQNQFDRLIQSMTQLGAEFGKPMGELAKLLLKLTRGSIDLLTSINESLGGALSWLVTVSGLSMMVMRFPLLGPIVKGIAGSGAQKWTNYMHEKGADTSGFWTQIISQFAIETAAGGLVMGGYQRFARPRQDGDDPLRHQRQAHKRMNERKERFYEDLIDGGYSEVEARRMADDWYEKGEQWYQNEYMHKSVGAAAVSGGAPGGHDDYWDEMVEKFLESKWFKAQAKRAKEGKKITSKSQWPKWIDFRRLDKEHRRLVINDIGRPQSPKTAVRRNYEQFMESLENDFLADDWAWRNSPDMYAHILAKHDRQYGPASVAEENFHKAILSGEIELGSDAKYDLEKRKTLDKESMEYSKRRAEDYKEKWTRTKGFMFNYARAYRSEIDTFGIQQAEKRLKSQIGNVYDIIENPYIDENLKREATSVAEMLEETFRERKYKGDSHYNPPAEGFQRSAGRTDKMEAETYSANWKGNMDSALNRARSHGKVGTGQDDIQYLMGEMEYLSKNEHLGSKRREEAGKMRKILEDTIQAGTYKNVFEEQKAKRKVELEEDKKFKAEAQERYNREQAAQKAQRAEYEAKRAAPPPPPPPPPPSGGGSDGSGGSGFGGGPKAIYDPATGQYLFDYGTGHRWGTLPQQVPLDLGQGGATSKLTQLLFESAGFGVGAVGTEALWRKFTGPRDMDDDPKAQQRARVRKEYEREQREYQRRSEEEMAAIREQNREKRKQQRQDDRDRKKAAENFYRKQRFQQKNWAKEGVYNPEDEWDWRADQEFKRAQGEAELRKQRQASQEDWQRFNSPEGQKEWKKQQSQWEKPFRTPFDRIGDLMGGIGEGLLGAVGFGAGGFFESRFGEKYSNFKKGRFASDFGLGKAGIGIKEFFGQAKAREMPKDISKMAYFLGRMFRMATGPVGLGLTVGSLGWWGTNKYVNSTEWGQEQGRLRDWRATSIFNRNNVLNWQDMQANSARGLVSDWQFGRGRMNPPEYSWLAALLDEGLFDGTISHFGRRFKEMKDRGTARKTYEMALGTNMPPEELEKVREMIAASGWSVGLSPDHPASGRRFVTTRKLGSYGSQYKMNAIKVPENLFKLYNWLDAQDIFGGAGSLIEGEPNLQALQDLATSGALEGLREQYIIERNDYHRAFPERRGENPVIININNNNTMNIDNATQDTKDMINEELETRDQLTIDLINRRMIRYFGRPIE